MTLYIDKSCHRKKTRNCIFQLGLILISDVARVQGRRVKRGRGRHRKNNLKILFPGKTFRLRKIVDPPTRPKNFSSQKFLLSLPPAMQRKEVGKNQCFNFRQSISLKSKDQVQPYSSIYLFLKCL